MTRQILRDPKGQLLGWIQPDPSTGHILAYRAGGNVLGWYIPNFGPGGRTFDNKGQPLGQGNHLSSLFYR